MGNDVDVDAVVILFDSDDEADVENKGQFVAADPCPNPPTPNAEEYTIIDATMNRI